MDAKFMHQAIAVGERGKLTAVPNPWVGCLLVKNERVIAEGYHRQPGTAHAEPTALKIAGDNARGATCYVTLEPCSHHGRTPPCADALITAGISRVVIGVVDPDRHVSGAGVARLLEAGIDVEVGIEAEAVERSLRPYLFHRRQGRPLCLLKAGISADGKIASRDGTSQWITTAEAREDAHRLRAESQAIVVGAQTAINDRPRLTVRLDGVDCRPLRILLDGRGRAPADGPLADNTLAPTLVATTEASDDRWRSSWEAAGAEVVILKAIAPGEGDVSLLLSLLAERGVLQVMLEGGSGVYNAFWKQGFVDQLTLYVGPRLLGGDGIDVLSTTFPSLKDSPILTLEGSSTLGQSVRMDYGVGVTAKKTAVIGR